MSSVTLEGADRAIANLEALGRQGAIGLRQAINDTARAGRVLIVRNVVSHLKLKPSYVRPRVYIKVASGDSLTASLTAKDQDRAVLLSRYSPRQVWKKGGKGQKRKRAGISVQVLQGSERKTLPGAFFITLKTNHLQAVAIRERNEHGQYTNRRYEKKPDGKKGNIAVDVLYGPGIYQQFKWMLPELQTKLSAKLRAEATRQYERRLPK